MATLKAVLGRLFASVRSSLAVVGVLAVILSVAGGVVASHYAQAAKDSQHAADAAHAALVAALGQVQAQASRAIAAESRADSLALVAQTNATKARDAETRMYAMRANVERIPACDTAAAPTFAASDSALVHWHTAYDSATAAANAYRVALDSSVAATKHIVEASSHADSTARAVPTREPFLARIRPRLGVGAAAGINPLGRPDAVLGVTFGWRF